MGVNKLEIEKCLEDPYRRFGNMESLHKNVVMTVELWSERSPHTGVSGHPYRFQTWPDLLRRVITMWWDMDFCVELETKRCSSHWISSTSPETRKARQSNSNGKVMLIAFSDARSIIHNEFLILPSNQSLSLPRNPAAYASFCVLEEARIVAGQIVAALLRQCTYS